MQPPFWVHEKVWNDCFMAIILVFFDSKTPNKTFIKVGTPSLIKHRFVWIFHSAKRKFQGDIFLPIKASQDFSGFRSHCSTTKKLLRCTLPHLEYHGQCKILIKSKSFSCIQAKAICHCSETDMFSFSQSFLKFLCFFYICRFSLLGNPEYFAIDSVSSNITTTEKLDREVICMDNIDEPCIQEIDVVVRPNSIEHFQMIKVQVMYFSIPTIFICCSVPLDVTGGSSWFPSFQWVC